MAKDITLLEGGNYCGNGCGNYNFGFGFWGGSSS